MTTDQAAALIAALRDVSTMLDWIAIQLVIIILIVVFGSRPRD